MEEREMYLKIVEREYLTTVKVLQAYPGSGELRPSDKSKTARELAFGFAAEQMMLQNLLAGKGLDGKMPPTPATMKEALAAYENAHKETLDMIRKLDAAKLNAMTKFLVGPKKMGELRLMDVLWMMLFDTIHHRGQFSVYLRIAGGKVPSIYGPSADEPWM